MSKMQTFGLAAIVAGTCLGAASLLYIPADKTPVISRGEYHASVDDSNRPRGGLLCLGLGFHAIGDFLLYSRAKPKLRSPGVLVAYGRSN